MQVWRIWLRRVVAVHKQRTTLRPYTMRLEIKKYPNKNPLKMTRHVAAEVLEMHFGSALTSLDGSFWVHPKPMKVTVVNREFSPIMASTANIGQDSWDFFILMRHRSILLYILNENA